MTGQLFWERSRFRRRIAGVSAIALAAQAVAAPESRLQNAPSPVAKITAEELSNVPGNRDLRAILDLHNGLRKEVGARPLRWSGALTANAQRYADKLAVTGRVEHDSREGRENERENIIVGPLSGISPVQMAQIWANEKQHFRAGKFPDVCTGGWTKCGHYTQIIWETTIFVGCGYAKVRFVALVCRYSPPGNKDGHAVGPGSLTQARDVAERICTTPRGMVIACKNDEEEEDGGVIEDDGGAEAEDVGGEEEEVCTVDVNVHKPISVDPAEPVIDNDKEFTPGATTLRNDDSDWTLGREAGAGSLPIITLPTDLTRSGNANENDLVKVEALNPNALKDVFLFAFPTHAEANRDLNTPVSAINGGRQATAQELAYFTGPTKPAPPAAGLPRAIPGPTAIWVEAQLGGQYRMVIGKLLEGVKARDVRYNRKTGQAYYMKEKAEMPAFECEDQATVTAAVVDIYQMNTNDKSKRLTAFDVYWAGRPHFRAKVWPGGQKFSWGEPYRLGAAVHQMAGTAVDGKVALMERDAEDGREDRNASLDGPTVAAKGTANGDFSTKGSIVGGFQIESPQAGNVPTVNRNVGDRYPKRVSLEYEVNGDKLVRPEYLEIILPRVRPPQASLRMGNSTGVESGVNYTIVDVFDRHIKVGKDSTIADYLYLYGAGLKAWEALGGQEDRVIETGKTGQRDDFNDYLFITNTGIDGNGNQRDPIGPLGTAQRSQASVHANRMTEGIFKDTLIFTSGDENAREALWVAAQTRGQQTPDQTRQRLVNEATDRDNALNNRPDPNKRYKNAAERRADIADRRAAVPRADLTRITSSNVLSIPQDVILQLRIGTVRKDLMVFEGNQLTVFAPYFFNNNKYLGVKTAPVFQFHMQFQPGAATSQLVDPPHRRP